MKGRGSRGLDSSYVGKGRESRKLGSSCVGEGGTQSCLYTEFIQSLIGRKLKYWVKRCWGDYFFFRSTLALNNNFFYTSLEINNDKNLPLFSE